MDGEEWCMHRIPGTGSCPACAWFGREARPAPADPVSSQDANAVVRHEHFMSYVRAGFTRAEALDLIKSDSMLGLLLLQAQPPQAGDG